MKLTYVFFILCFGIVGCADRKYGNPQDSTSGTFGFHNFDCKLQFSNKICLSWSWEKKPTMEEAGSLWIRTYRQSEIDGFPELVELSSGLQVKLWMPDMGHGSSPVKTEAMSPGSFHSTNVFFSMPGSWQIRFQIKSEGHELDEVIADYSF
ncbi:MAG: hypothetical protein AB7F59_15215 [Bdellovibrionales bacterium]